MCASAACSTAATPDMACAIICARAHQHQRARNSHNWMCMLEACLKTAHISVHLSGCMLTSACAQVWSNSNLGAVAHLLQASTTGWLVQAAALLHRAGPPIMGACITRPFLLPRLQCCACACKQVCGSLARTRHLATSGALALEETANTSVCIQIRRTKAVYAQSSAARCNRGSRCKNQTGRMTRGGTRARANNAKCLQ